MHASVSTSSDAQRRALASAYLDVRRRSEALCAPLAVEDYVIQMAPEASPAKWHLAHVSWFFETFLLKEYVADYTQFHPAYADLPETPNAPAPAVRWIELPGGIHEIGDAGGRFAYDNEKPRHRVYLNPFRLASRAVTNGEYLAFVDDGGYCNPSLWLADAWATVKRERWTCPLYWEAGEGGWSQFTLGGSRALRLGEPVCHLSYYEADAYATWAGKRLPTEAEWETATRGLAVTGNLGDRGYLQPVVASGAEGLLQMFGDVWEHTASAYQGYPGFRPAAGALGEYNGKFMSGQMVSRGGSCVTAPDHVRPSYRNFFYPHERWQFLGIRLAEGA